MGTKAGMRPTILKAACAVAALITMSSTAHAKMMLDCPLRDAPHSVDGPLVDIMLSDAAKQAIEAHSPGVLAQIPPFFTGTKAPTFGSILTLRHLLTMVPPSQKVDVDALEKSLNALPVTAADKRARCERYDDERPTFKQAKGKPRILLFEKMTGFRDTPSVNAANAAFRTLAQRNGWSLVVTDKGGAMHPSVLKKFDAVVWNNVSGDVLTLSQRKAFSAFVENGGGYVGIHGSAGDPVYFWDWYPDTLIGARFIGHPSDPQFQDARVVIEPSASGIGKDLAPGWTMNDEWYSFAKSARLNGANIVATLDETSYKPGASRFGGPPLEMGADHPIAWTRCVGKGRSFYSAIGHRPETYADANHLKMLEQAVAWAAAGKSGACASGDGMNGHKHD